MKKTKNILIFIITFMFCTFTTLATNQIIKVTNSTIVINGINTAFSTPTISYNSRTLVPMREIFEKLGATVVWDNSSQTVTATTETKTIVMKINKTEATANNLTIPLDCQPVIYRNKTMVPLRFVGEQLNLKVLWDGKSNTINLNNIGDTKKGQCAFEFEGHNLIYIGEMVNSVPFGMGALYYNISDKNAMIQGNFKNGAVDGYAIYNVSEGNTYRGNFASNKVSGQGTFKWSDGTIYEGAWKDNARNGQGKYTWEDGTYYIGNWVDDSRSGHGKLYIINGDKYEGNWLNDKMNGNGTYYFANGIKEVGLFKDGQIVSGTRTLMNGTTSPIGDNSFVSDNKNDTTAINTETIRILPNNGDKIVLKKGFSYTVNLQLNPYDFNTNNLMWTTSNPNVVLVWNATHVLQPINEGTSIITVTTPNGASSSCTVLVEQ